MIHLRSIFWRVTPLALVLVGAEWADAQDSLHARLPTVRVTATREGPRAPLELPWAVTLVRPDTLAALRKTGVDELLFAVPGVALANRQNPAQDPRVSIRGFGARSAFGVRGVRVLQDGVPVTLPDGFHYIVPIMMVVGWVLFGPRPRIEARTIGLAILWPVVWVVYTLIHGAITSWYPYPFVDVITHGYAQVFVNAGLVVVVLLFVTAVFWMGDRRLPPPLRASSLPTNTPARPASD